MRGESIEAAGGLPTYADVARAADRIAGVAHRTPVLTSRTADAMTGAKLFFKAENLQKGGAFKFRGASYSLSCLTPDKLARGVCTHSSGTADVSAHSDRMDVCTHHIVHFSLSIR